MLKEVEFISYFLPKIANLSHWKCSNFEVVDQNEENQQQL
jgi:hypothetical protein